MAAAIKANEQLTVERNTNHFSPEGFSKLEEIMYDKAFSRGSSMFWEGDTSDELYFIKEGTVRLTKLSDDGKNLALYYFYPGDLFGEFDPCGGQLSTFTAEALTHCQIGVIQQKDLEVNLWRNGDLAIEFSKWQNHMQRYTQLKLRDLLFYGKNGALASTLIRAGNTYGLKDADKIHISRKFTNSELANLIGATRETVNRMLATFKKDGLIAYEHGLITILKLNALKDICRCEECAVGICRL